MKKLNSLFFIASITVSIFKFNEGFSKPPSKTVVSDSIITFVEVLHNISIF